MDDLEARIGPDGALSRVMAGFEDRLSAETYAGEEPVSVGCASHDGDIDWVAEIPESIFVRAQLVADAYALHQLPAIDRNRETRINRQQCRGINPERFSTNHNDFVFNRWRSHHDIQEIFPFQALLDDFHVE